MVQTEIEPFHSEISKLSSQWNGSISEFPMGLFFSFTAIIWVNYKSESLRKLKVAFTDASQLFCSNGLTTFQALLRNLMHRFKCRLDGSLNEIIMVLVNPSYSSVRYQSQIWKHWYKCLLWLLVVCFMRGCAPRSVLKYAHCKFHQLFIGGVVSLGQYLSIRFTKYWSLANLIDLMMDLFFWLLNVLMYSFLYVLFVFIGLWLR